MNITDITQDSCSAIITTDGNDHRKCYVNNARGRAEFMSECADAENYADVLMAWGDTPTITDPIPMQHESPSPTLEQRVETCETDIDQIVTGLEALANG